MELWFIIQHRVVSGIADSLSRLVPDGTIGIAVREKYADKAAGKAKLNERSPKPDEAVRYGRREV